jgi:hypothetical protein
MPSDPSLDSWVSVRINGASFTLLECFPGQAALYFARLLLIHDPFSFAPMASQS